MPDRIDALARRVQTDPFFLAAALHDFAQGEGLDEPGLAAMLGCPVATLARLGLCRRPRPDPPLFGQDVERIATRFGVRADALAEIVRRADALTALRQEATGARGTLMAARDHVDHAADSPAAPMEPDEAPS